MHLTCEGADSSGSTNIGVVYTCTRWQVGHPECLGATPASGWVTHLVRDFDEEAEALRGL